MADLEDWEARLNKIFQLEAGTILHVKLRLEALEVSDPSDLAMRDSVRKSGDLDSFERLLLPRTCESTGLERLEG